MHKIIPLCFIHFTQFIGNVKKLKFKVSNFQFNFKVTHRSDECGSRDIFRNASVINETKNSQLLASRSLRITKTRLVSQFKMREERGNTRLSLSLIFADDHRHPGRVVARGDVIRSGG